MQKKIITLAKKIIPRPGKVKKISDKKYPKIIKKSQEANTSLKELLNSGKPVMISRIGSVELNCISHYWQKRKNKKNPKEYPKLVKFTAQNNAGIFPNNNKILDKFSQLFINCIKDVDALGVWNNKFEDYVCKNFCPNAQLVKLSSLEPFRHHNPWSILLKNKKILVIHPFVESIKKQYQKRKKLFKDPDVLPDFHLITLKAIQSNGEEKTKFKNWFEAYDYLCKQIDDINFDIAIIGAGSYGLPLASYIKRKKRKSAIHLGGVTQILFGIKGKRWDGKDDVKCLYNEHWIRPSNNETPKGHSKIENGCYW